MPQTDDSELIAASLAEPARFAELFDRHFPAIHRYLRRRVGPELADDLAAETFTQAFGQRRRYQPKYPDAAAWLYGIAANLIRQNARAELRRLHAYARAAGEAGGADAGEPDEGERVAERVDATAAAGHAAAAIAELPASQREVLLLLAWGGLDGPRIADALNLSHGTVRTRLHRARQSLRQRLARTVVLDELSEPGANTKEDAHERA